MIRIFAAEENFNLSRPFFIPKKSKEFTGSENQNTDAKKRKRQSSEGEI